MSKFGLLVSGSPSVLGRCFGCTAGVRSVFERLGKGIAVEASANVDLTEVIRWKRWKRVSCADSNLKDGSCSPSGSL